MTPENVERLGRMFVAWDRGDKQAWLRETANAEVHTSGTWPGVDPVYRGREGMERWWEFLREPWDTWNTEINRVEDLGSTILLLFTVRARGKGSGAETELKWGYLISEDDGYFRLENQPSWEAALEAAGLRE
jgi:hypothetical protein